MKLDLNFKLKTFNKLPVLKWLSSKKYDPFGKGKHKGSSESKFKSRRGIFEIFYPKAIGLALKDNDLLVTMVSKRAFSAERKTITIRDFLSKDLEDVQLGINPFFKRSLNEIVLSLPRNQALVREIDFPGSDLKELKGALEYQLDSFLPYTNEEVYYDLYKVDNDDQIRKILIIAVKKNDLDPVIERLAYLGMDPTKVIISPISFMGIISEKKGKLVTIHKWNSDYCYNIFFNGLFCSTYLINGKESLLKKIEKDLPDEILENDNLLLSKENFYEVIRDDNSADNHEEVGEEEGNVIPGSKSIPISRLDDNQESFGAALYGVKSVGSGFNLFETGKQGIHLQKFLMFGLLGFFILIMFLMPHVIKHRRAEMLNIVNNKIKGIKGNIFRIEDIQNSLTEMEETLIDVGKLRSEYVPRIKILSELAEKLPKNAWIKELYIYRNNFEIGGTAKTATALIPTLENSVFFSNVGFTAPVINTAEGKESFRIKGEINVINSDD